MIFYFCLRAGGRLFTGVDGVTSHQMIVTNLFLDFATSLQTVRPALSGRLEVYPLLSPGLELKQLRLLISQ